jgi:hypothetical protein
MPVRPRSVPLLAVAVLPALGGCRGPRPAAPPAPAPLRVALSSAGSDYSPEVRALVRVRADGDSLRLEVDSGAVTAPGRPTPGLPAVMADLDVTAYLAVPRPPGSPEAGAAGAAPGGTAWVARAAAPARVRIDSLRLGVPHPLAGARFALPRPAADAGRAYLVLGVTGAALELGRGRDGVVRAGRVIYGGVRVYACAAANLDGRADSARAAALARAYTAAC